MNERTLSSQPEDPAGRTEGGEGLARLREPLRFGPDNRIELSGRVGLAPLAGVSEQIFRLICHEHGSAFAVTELVSARGIVYSGLEKSWRYLALHKDEGPAAIQLFGADPEDFAEAARRILSDERLAGPDSPLIGVDINMGCPVEKVVKTGAGAALMEDPARAGAITRAIQEVFAEAGREELAVTAKIRLGFGKEAFTAPEVSRELVKNGADLIVIHGRTRAQMYRGEADREKIARTVAATRDASEQFGRQTAAVGNGDIDTVASALHMMDVTACDAVMIGRAAEGNPWIFELEDRKPPVETRIAAVRRHSEGLIGTLGEKTALREFRKTLIRYLHGSAGASELRRQAGTIQSVEDLDSVLDAWQRLN